MSISHLISPLQVKLVDAGFIWTEPHSKRIKVKLTIQVRGHVACVFCLRGREGIGKRVCVWYRGREGGRNQTGDIRRGGRRRSHP